MRGKIEIKTGQSALLEKGAPVRATLTDKAGYKRADVFLAERGVLVNVYQDYDFQKATPVLVRYEDIGTAAIEAVMPPEPGKKKSKKK